MESAMRAVVLTVLAVFGHAILAQDTPPNKTQAPLNFEDTMAWLRTYVLGSTQMKVGTDPTHPNESFGQHYTTFEWSGCSVAAVRTNWTTTGKKETQTYKFNFVDLDPTDIRLRTNPIYDDYTNVELLVSDGKMKIKTLWHDDKWYNTAAVDFTFSPTTAPHVTKAFRHAIELCGGKASAF